MKSFALVAIAALALAASPAFADPAVCSQLSEELPEQLASAMQHAGLEGDIDATFDVDAKGVVRLISLQGPRLYFGRVRSALESLECTGGTPHRYVLKIRFAAHTPRAAAITTASTDAASKPR